MQALVRRLVAVGGALRRNFLNSDTGVFLQSVRAAAVAAPRLLLWAWSPCIKNHGSTEGAIESWCCFHGKEWCSDGKEWRFGCHQ